MHFKGPDRVQFARDRVRKAHEPPEQLRLAQAFERRVQSYVQNMREDLQADAVAAPTDASGPWLLYKDSAKSVVDAKGSREIHARFCQGCSASTARKPEPEHSDTSYRHLMPPGARADGFWGGPMPSQIAALGPLASKIIRLAHISCSILRVKLSPDEYARKIHAGLRIPAFVTGNVMAVPQYGEEFPVLLGVLPSELAACIQVQFQGDSKLLADEPAITVSVPLLKEAFAWLLTHNWYWILATAEEDIDLAAGNYGARLNALLQAFADELRGKADGVPSSVEQAATSMPDGAAMQVDPGPVDAASHDKAPDLASAALLNSSSSCSLALQQVEHIMREHKAIMQLDAEAARETNDEARLNLVKLELVSLENVRKALEDITASTLRQELILDLKNHSSESPVVKTVIRCGSEYLKSYSQDFWPKVFLEAFPRGDCLEKPGQARVHGAFGVDWTRLLLSQMDKPWLRCHEEWLAATMLYFIRLDQIRQTEALVNHSSKLHADAAVFHRLHAHDLNLLSSQASDSATLRSLIKKRRSC